MIKSPTDVGFIHDISHLDKLRQQANSGDKEQDKQALNAAAKQFESIFTSMLFKSMRDANTSFKSGLFDSQNEQFYHQMLDDQMASELSASGSLGLADMIVAQLSLNQGDDVKSKSLEPHHHSAQSEIKREHNLPLYHHVPVAKDTKIASMDNVNTVTALEQLQKKSVKPLSFKTPEQFVKTLAPYAKKAASALGIEPSLLIAQAALETGWGSKIIKNVHHNSHNLFNIKADRSWQGAKVATQTMEYQDNIPVKENAAFRSYAGIQESFDDYVTFLQSNPRYQTALNQHSDSDSFIKGIHEAGYATDPLYANKVLQVKKRIDNM